MPVQIGSTSHPFSDPTGLLSDCHRRIEMFLGSLQAAAKMIDGPLTDEVRTALDSALRYFREAAPKHNADEEESLFPRLRQAAASETQSGLQALTGLEGEHRWAAPLHEEVDQLGRKYLSDGHLSAAETSTFRKAVDSLASMYRQHIAIEDSLVFPLAARILSREDKTAIAGEMAARRNLRFVAETTSGDVQPSEPSKNSR
jgi:hemerythrin-like domain-containing protein